MMTGQFARMRALPNRAIARAGWSLSAIAGLTLIHACAPRPGASTDDAADDTSGPPIRISLERTACFGSCPTYRVTVTTDGTAFFLATRTPERTDTVRLSAAAVAELAAEFRDAGFLSLDSAYVPGHPLCRLVATDHPSAILTFERADTSKRVQHYHGCLSGDPSDPPPDRSRNPTGVLATLKRLAERVDSVAGTGAWLKRRGSGG